MGLDCTVTVKGSRNGGSRQNGAPEGDQSRPVSGFICGSEVYYRVLCFNHNLGRSVDGRAAG